MQDVVRLVRGGDAAAVQVVRQAGRDLGEVVATLVNLINPSAIVIGGSLADAGESLLAGIREVVYSALAAAGHRAPADRSRRWPASGPA